MKPAASILSAFTPETTDWRGEKAKDAHVFRLFITTHTHTLIKHVAAEPASRRRLKHLALSPPPPPTAFGRLPIVWRLLLVRIKNMPEQRNVLLVFFRFTMLP